MMKNKLTTMAIIGCMAFMISCTDSKEKSENESTTDNDKMQVEEVDTETKEEPKAQDNSDASSFVENLKAGNELNSFFSENWTLVYHEDNRCDGSTDGQIDDLESSQVNAAIKLEVENDGEGWACDKKEPSTFDLEFDLRKKVADWDRFEIPGDESQEENVVYVLGMGASDYIVLHYNDEGLISTLEYKSEDPG